MQSHDTQKSLGKSFWYIACFLALGLLYMFFDDQLGKQWNPNQQVAGGKRGEITLKRNKYGHYVATGMINNVPVVFLLDTGATDVAIPSGVANRIGLERGLEFTVSTANGLSSAYQTDIDSLQLGSIYLQDVRASIATGLNGEEILLGMSALKQLEFTQRGDELIIKQY